MEAFGSKWDNSNYILYGVYSLRLGGIQKYYKKTSLKKEDLDTLNVINSLYKTIPEILGLREHSKIWAFMTIKILSLLPNKHYVNVFIPLSKVNSLRLASFYNWKVP